MGTTINQPIIKDLGHDRLLEALFFFWDAFERSNINFFLIRDTAKQVMAGSSLSGDRLTLGLRKLEWIGGQERVFKAFMEYEKYPPKNHGDNYMMFDYKGVPVYLYIYDENPALEALDVVFYQNDTFNIPNPMSVFEKYDK